MAATVLVALVAPGRAMAISGFYLELAGGLGLYDGDDLVVYEVPDTPGEIPISDPDDCCAGLGGAGEVRVGFGIGGYVAPEFQFTGNIFDAGEDFGGSAFIGGGARVFFLRLLSLSGLPSDKWPIEFSLGTTFGYTTIGRDLAYKGWYYAFDPKIDFKVTKFLNIGFKSGIFVPQYDPFQYTDFGLGLGRCTNASGTVDIDPMNPISGIQTENDGCPEDARGPDAVFFNPSITLTFHFNPIGGNKDKSAGD